MASSLYTVASGLVGPEGLGATATSDPSSVVFAGGGAIDVVWRSSSNTLWVAQACRGCAAPAIPVFTPRGSSGLRVVGQSSRNRGRVLNSVEVHSDE
jgi:hypothetical protein